MVLEKDEESPHIPSMSPLERMKKKGKKEKESKS